jgi:hypothetical protein
LLAGDLEDPQTIIAVFYVIVPVLYCRLCPAKNVTGTVINQETKQPLAGVSVTVKGTQKGVQTDNSGRFSISAADGSTLVFSYVGFLDYEVKAAGQN